MIDPLTATERRPCASCGGEVGPDRYCLRCGLRAPRPRDHITERPAPWVAGVCDRGRHKAGNEDAMALLASARPGERAALVVLDGVSAADDSADAALAGAVAAREALRPPLPPSPDEAATLLARATAAANRAIVEHADPASPNPASATFVAAVLEGPRIVHAAVGDSRAYWLPDAGEPVQLTTDDSIGHGLTKWLGRDSEDPTPRVDSIEVTGPGWLLVCSDGFWNYAPAPAAVQHQVASSGANSAAELADALLRFACEAGGHDNVTVALARVGGIRDNGTSDVDEREATDG